ncbi:MAG: helix-turn-helix domain-containing protein [Leptospirales bacterium]
MTYIGLTLRHARRLMGWSQRELAQQTGLGQSHIQRVEQGEDLRLSTLKKLFDPFDADLVLVPREISGIVRHMATNVWRKQGLEALGNTFPDDEDRLFTIANTAEGE